MGNMVVSIIIVRRASVLSLNNKEGYILKRSNSGGYLYG